MGSSGSRRRRALQRLGLNDSLEEYISDPNLGSLRGQIALTEARLTALQEELAALSESSVDKHLTTVTSALTALFARYKAVRAAQEARSAVGMAEALSLLGQEMDRAQDAIPTGIGAILEQAAVTGKSRSALWAEVYEVQDLRRRLTDTWGKNLQRMQQQMTTEQGGQLVYALARAVRERILDVHLWARGPQAILSAISQDLRAVMVSSHAAPDFTDAEVVDAEVVETPATAPVETPAVEAPVEAPVAVAPEPEPEPEPEPDPEES